MMRHSLRSLVTLAGLFATLSGSAQVLNTFDAFESPNTTFVGSWAANGDTTSGDTAPIATFSQDVGSYVFDGGLNDDTSGVYYFFDTAMDVSGSSLLSISAQLLGGNTAATFQVTLFDNTGGSATAVFSTSDFVGSTFVTGTATLTTTTAFNATDVGSFVITGATLNGVDTLSLKIDELTASASAIPEPSTYAALAGVGALGLAAWRRRRTA